MLPVLTAAEMREADRRTIEEIGLPGPVLMENAGAAVAAAIDARYAGVRRIVILCGKGNNGGDGFVIARRLKERRPEVLLLGRRTDVKGDARIHLGAYERSGGALTEVVDVDAWGPLRERVVNADLVVDAILGTGLASEPTGLAARVIADFASLGAPPPIVAVDLPSGVRSDSGDLAWPTVRAACTVTFAAPKHGHVLAPACDQVGELIVADIGIPAAVLAQDVRLFLIEAADAARAVPPRSPASHKGDYGHVLVIAGSVGKTGAAALCTAGALRTGAGLVTVATPADALPLLSPGLRAEAMAEPLPLTDSGGLGKDAIERALALAESRDVVVLGPGLGSGADVRSFVREMLARCPRPMIVDADGLNAVAPTGKGEGALALLRRSAPTIVTPHPGEMARLSSSSTPEVQRRRLEVARAFAIETGATVVLKGQRTIVADATGRAAVNPTGNPGMASGGSGDVLAGIVGALLARTEVAWLAATAGVFLHGRAGDLAAADLGEDALLAGDLVDHVPEAIRSVQEERA
jgi:NAD(P)H-hydrate epimerase